MKRIITYMVKHGDGSFGIKNDVFEKPITEENIAFFLAEKKENEIKRTREVYSHMPNMTIIIDCYFISITPLDS